MFSCLLSIFSTECNIFMLLLAICFCIFTVCFFKLDSDVTLYFYDKYGDHASKLANKVVWITGASSGIGEYLAYELAQCRSRLVLSGTSAERLEKVKKQCLNLGLSERDLLILPFNMCNHVEHYERLNDALKQFGRVDILVNNAGRSQRAQFLDIDLEVDKQMFELNVFAALNLTRHVVRHFIETKNGGQVAVTSSCAGKMGLPGSASYTGAKHAIHGYFEALRTEFCSKNVNVTIACPGPVFSRFLENAFTDKPDTKFGQPTQATDRRMATDRCARLMAVGIAYKLDELWISLQPCLMLYYLSQYTPTFFRKVLIERFYTPEIANKLREGRW